MKHYSREEWNSYIKDLISEDEKNSMENHLRVCESCLNLYIEMLEKEENSKNIDAPLDFVSNVMSVIDKNTLKRNNSFSNRKKIFIYYTTAACITLFLMGSGAFRVMTKSIPLATSELIQTPAKIEASIFRFKLDSINLKIMNLLKNKL